MINHFMMFHVMMDNHRIMQEMHNHAVYTGQLKYPDFRSKYKDVPYVVLDETPYKESIRLQQARLNYVPLPLPNTRRTGSGVVLLGNRAGARNRKTREIIASCGALLVVVVVAFLFGYFTSL